MLTATFICAALVACTQAGSVRRRLSVGKGTICPLYCSLDILDPIQLCGSDGRTYDNRCEFDLAHCHNPRLQVAFKGRCPVPVQARGIICTTPWCWPADAPVCGSDGLTYQNQCELNNAMCEKESLKTEYHGPCHPDHQGRRFIAPLRRDDILV